MPTTPDRLESHATQTDEPKKLFRLIEPSFADLRTHDAGEFFRACLARVAERFGEECAIRDFVLARRDGSGWRAVDGTAALLARVDALEAASRETLFARQIAFLADPAPAVLWLLGSRSEWLAILRLEATPDEGRALLLQMARLAIQQRSLQSSWTGLLDQARAIQRSLLPDPLPGLAGFEFAARSEAADVVGGDVYDVLPLGPSNLGLMIADASGHGLPAALEARDVVVGLRMGASLQMKIDATIERLNRILCTSTLSSRFVSLVYGELDDTGCFDYINAGHPAPLLINRHVARPLPESGRVLGVSPGSAYRVARAEVPPGNMLLFYTDGVTECAPPGGEEFGLERLSDLARALSDAPAAYVVSRIFDALEDHAFRDEPSDDCSVLVVKRA